MKGNLIFAQITTPFLQPALSKITIANASSTVAYAPVSKEIIFGLNEEDVVGFLNPTPCSGQQVDIMYNHKSDICIFTLLLHSATQSLSAFFNEPIQRRRIAYAVDYSFGTRTRYAGQTIQDCKKKRTLGRQVLTFVGHGTYDFLFRLKGMSKITYN